jgi:hypothetical protein
MKTGTEDLFFIADKITGSTNSGLRTAPIRQITPKVRNKKVFQNLSLFFCCL